MWDGDRQSSDSGGVGGIIFSRAALAWGSRWGMSEDFTGPVMGGSLSWVIDFSSWD